MVPSGLSSQADDLQAARDKEPTLKAEYKTKLAQAINLDALKKQKEEVQTYVTQLEKQLPGKAEMDALLTDINQAGVGRGLVIDQFIPGQTETKEYYAELPIAIRVTGRFHDIGAFAADIAALSRIVTLHNLSISPDSKSTGGGLVDGSACADLSLPRSDGSRRGSQGRRPGQGQEMNRLLCITAGALMLSALGACTADNDELIQWMEQQHKEIKPSIAPIFPPKKFDPQAYLGVTGVEPFGSQKLIPVGGPANGKGSALLVAAKAHATQELESYPLDSMSMVGSLQQGGKAHALIMVESRLHDVKVGDWIGQNYGQITAITDSQITLRETVQDPTGEWIERTSTLQIQEKAR